MDLLGKLESWVLIQEDSVALAVSMVLASGCQGFGIAPVNTNIDV